MTLYSPYRETKTCGCVTVTSEAERQGCALTADLSGRLQAAHRLIETYEQALNEILELCPLNCEVSAACVICRTALRALESREAET